MGKFSLLKYKKYLQYVLGWEVQENVIINMHF